MDFTNPHFAEPRWLWLAWMAPGLLLLLLPYAARARRRQMAAFAAPDLHESLLRSHSARRRVVKNLLVILIMAGLGLALARPQWGEQEEVTQALGEDVLFVLDGSRSMMAADVRPNRLTRAKLAILDFVQRFGRGRIGLVVFAGQAFLQCPLTFDYDAFGEALMAVDDQTIPVPGTDIGRALDEAFLAMEKDRRRKSMVLVTDGEDLEKLGIKKARALAEKGVVVYAIGVGTPAGAPLLVGNAQGVLEPVRHASGQPVESRLDEATLRAIAEATHGLYEPLGALGEGMTKVRQSVDSAAFLPGASPRRKLGVDRFHVPLAVVTVLLVVESLLGTRRRGRAVLPLLLLFLSAGVPSASAAELAVKPPVTPRDFYNDGTQKLRQGKWREAEQALQTAVGTQNERVQAPALYNLGHVRFQQGLEALKEGPKPEAMQAAGRSALVQADTALQQMDATFMSIEENAILAAYLQGRGARRQLKAAMTAVKKAMDLYGGVLLRWQRASGDFKSAFELNPADTDAKSNAEIVDRAIAELVERVNELEMMMQMMGKKRDDLGQKMKELKGRLPKGKQPDGEDEDEEEGEAPPNQPQEEQKESPTKPGREMQMSREEALRLLEALQLEGRRKLPMGFDQTGNPQDRKGREW
jgi:Mg-chelatase subunit ChlD